MFCGRNWIRRLGEAGHLVGEALALAFWTGLVGYGQDRLESGCVAVGRGLKLCACGGLAGVCRGTVRGQKVVAEGFCF